MFLVIFIRALNHEGHEEWSKNGLSDIEGKAAKWELSEFQNKEK
jgi:hypothetical protein